MSDRTYEVVLFGATGFTGRLVAEYFVQHGPTGLRWALAGRSREKLEGVRAELGERARAVPVVVADSHDTPALAALAKETRVIVSTVGPYMRHGLELVRACADAGTHYCDLTGEVPFIRETIDRHHVRAQETGARIVHSCGFDSIPSDLGVFMLHAHARAQGESLSWVKYFVGESKGGMSGGTIASMLNLLELMKKDPSVRRLMASPYALDPGGPRFSGPDGRDQRGVKWDPDIEMWTGPFLMAGINTRIVRRSNTLLDHAYGSSFRYSEAMSFGRGPKGLARASAFTAGLGTIAVVSQVDPLRAMLERRLPAPGEGPSKELREKGFFVIRLVAEARGENGRAPRRLTGRIEGKSDPGYGETAKMLGESALCLAFDGAELSRGGGVLTPASAMGKPLLGRLRRAGMVFDAA
jgi:short subunit dehydrogenase-like uncharacterized protein